MKKDFLETLRRLYRQRFKSGLAPIQPAEEIIPSLKKDGIVTLPGFYSKEFCNDVIKSIDQYIELNKINAEKIQAKVKDPAFKRGVPMEDGTNYWIDSLGSDKRIMFSEKLSPNINSFSQNTKFLNQGQALLGHALKLEYTMANRTSFLSNNLGSGGGWHRDNNYQHGYKALVYLTDVNDTNGPFEYLKQTFTLKNHLIDFPYPDKYQFTDEEISKFIAKYPHLYTRLTASAGTVVLFNVNAIHRGMPLKQGVRYALTNYYNW